MRVQTKRIIVELTHRCQAACSFCFLKASGRLNRNEREAAPAIWRKLVDSAPPGCDIYITGGEPLLRKDCLSLAERAKSRGLSCGINTLGLLADRATVERLNAAGLDYIIFSLHGPEDIHDAICGLKGAFRRAITNLRRFALMNARRTEILVSCTVCMENQSSLHGLYRLAAAAGADRVLFEHLQFFTPGEAAQETAPFCPAKAIAVKTERPEIDADTIGKQLALCAKAARTGGPALCVRPGLSRTAMDKWYRHTPSARPDCPPYRGTLVFSPDGKARFCQNYDIFAGDGSRSSVSAIADGIRRAETLSALQSLEKTPAACIRCCQRHGFSVTRGSR